MKIGIKGISYSSTERRYLVRVIRDSKRVYLGRFASLEEAKQALAQEQNEENTHEELPILASLRAEFAPKSSKKTTQKTRGKSVNNVLGNKSTHVPSKPASRAKQSPKTQTVKKSETFTKVLKETANKEVFPSLKDLPAVYFSNSLAEEMENSKVIISSQDIDKMKLTVDQVQAMQSRALFNRILMYLLEEAEKRSTSVFDVIAQEIAKLSKK